MTPPHAALRRAVATAALFLAAVAGAGVSAQDAGPTEPRIAAIRIVTQENKVLEQNAAGLPVAAGQPLDEEKVRESLKVLHRSGRFADVRAETAPAGNGVRLDFVVRENFYLGEVRVHGLDEPPNEALAVSVMRLGLGEIYREGDLKEAIGRLEQVLREEGLYQARVEYEVRANNETRQLDVAMRVAPGKRARIGNMALVNHTEFPDAQILGKTKLKAGRSLTTSRINKATERVRKFLTKKGHLSARVAVRRGEYSTAENTVSLEMEVVAAPKVRVEISGAKVPERQLRELLPIYQEGAVDEDLLQEGRRNLRAYFEREGYFDTTVSYTTHEDTENQRQVITYEVQRGRQRRLAGLEISGNRYFSSDLLTGRLRIQPAGVLLRGRFSRRLLADDEDSLREVYMANGFRGAQVRSEVLENYRGKEDDLFVRFQIEEGPQTLVAGLKLEGNTALDNETLMNVIGGQPGQPYSEANISSDRNNILAQYFNGGFPDARFEAEMTEPGPPNRVQVVYRITEGAQTRVDRVLLAGYQHTREDTVAREVQITAGEPLRQGDLVETQRRLYNLGIFSRVQIAPQNPEGTATDKTVVVLVEEAKRHTIAYGGGFEVQRLGSTTDPTGTEFRLSPRGLFEISKGNVLGRAHTLAFKVRGSSLQGRALLSYIAPNFLSRPSLTLALTGFAEKTHDVRTFAAQRYEGGVQLVQRSSPVTSFVYRYSFRHVLVDPDSLKIPPQQVPLFTQPTKISAVGMTWIRDRRDNPADAIRGDFNTVDFSVAPRTIGSTASFVRVFAQNSTFRPLTRRLSFARSTRFGVQEPFAGSMPIDIPLPERFFAGGGTSLRGFGLNQAGPRDAVTGFPVGGLAMLVFNQELRFPMHVPYLGDKVGGAVFYDAGNVFSTFKGITFRGSPTAADTLTGRLNYFSHSIGMGFRYGTPIGPVRLDLAYQLNAARFCVPSTTPSPACPAGGGLARVPRFQFFFNIGSIF